MDFFLQSYAFPEIKAYFCPCFLQVSMFRTLIYLALPLLFMACRGKETQEQTYTDETAFAGVSAERPAEGEPIVFHDSLDAANPEDQRTPPAAVDGNFDDFLYAFNVNRRFFVSRIALPFPATRGGTEAQLTDYADVRTLYQQTLRGGYTILHNDPDALLHIDRGTIEEADVDAIDLNGRQVATFHFEPRDDHWMMLAATETPLTAYPAAQFLTFYARFTTDAAYRLQHLDADIDITIPTDDGPVTGNISPAQFDAFVSDLATGTLVNIRLGQQLTDDDAHMYIRKCDLAMGDERILAFKKHQGEWILDAVQ